MFNLYNNMITLTWVCANLVFTLEHLFYKKNIYVFIINIHTQQQNAYTHNMQHTK